MRVSKVLFAAVGLLHASIASSEPCDESVMSMPGPDVQTSIGGVPLTAKTSILTKLDIASQSPGTAKVLFQTRVALNELQAKWPQIFQNFAKIPNGSCQDRYTVRDMSLMTSSPSATGTASIDYSNWWCTSLDVWCPTTGEPLRKCTKEQSVRNFGTTVDIQVNIQPEIKGNNVVISSSVTHSGGSVSGQLSFLGGLLGTALGGLPLGAGLSTIGTRIEAEISKGIREKIDAIAVEALNAPSIDPGFFPKDIKYEVLSSEFNTKEVLLTRSQTGSISMGGSQSGSPTLATMYASENLRLNSACYLRNRLMSKD